MIQWPKLLLLYLIDENRGGGGVAPWSVVRELRFTVYDALVYDVILPMQPRWHKGSILLTCGGEIGP
jgi:hypothetical protein